MILKGVTSERKGDVILTKIALLGFGTVGQGAIETFMSSRLKSEN